MKVDSHQHFWTIDRGDYGWLRPELGSIYRDFDPKDLAPILDEVAIDKTIVVQAADTVAETEFLLDLANQTAFIAGVVGWIDMSGPDAIKTLERLAQDSYFKGIRPMIQEISDDDWILRSDLDPMFDALVRMDLSFDALVLPRHLPQLLKRLDKHPDLRCVIDHAAKPELATGNLEAWRKDISRLAKNTSCHCKFSGLLTEAGPNFTINTVRHAAEHILDEFKGGRVMFGSDWPVVNLASDYAAWVQMVEMLIEGLSQNQRKFFWGQTAADFYRIQ